MREAGLTVSTLGNVSAAVAGGMLITPTRMPARTMGPDDLVSVALSGEVVRGDRPSRETPLHLEIYRRYPWIGAVVHTHSSWATAWSHTGRDLSLPTEELAYHGIRRVVCAPRADAGSDALASSVADSLEEAPAALLERHGVVAVGATPREALELCALVEQQAHINWLLRLDSLRSSR